MFSLEQFVADLRATFAERSRQATQEVVARAVSDPHALMREIGEPAAGGVTMLHQALTRNHPQRGLVTGTSHPAARPSPGGR